MRSAHDTQRLSDVNASERELAVLHVRNYARAELRRRVALEQLARKRKHVLLRGRAEAADEQAVDHFDLFDVGEINGEFVLEGGEAGAGLAAGDDDLDARGRRRAGGDEHRAR